MQTIVISVSDSGMRFLVSEETQCFLTDSSVIKRASHVEPVSGTLRLLFHALRNRFGDKGHMATFTRYWPCLWRINLAPSNGPILPGAWRNRGKAIESEIEYLNQNFIGE